MPISATPVPARDGYFTAARRAFLPLRACPFRGMGDVYSITMDPQFTARFLTEVRRNRPLDSSLHNNHQTLTSIYDALIRGDFEEFGRSLADDVEMEIRGLGAMDGSWNGRTQVTEAARANFSQVAQQKPEIECMVSEGDSTAVLFRESGVFVGGYPYRVRVVQWFTFANGRVRKIDELVASYPADRQNVPR